MKKIIYAAFFVLMLSACGASKDYTLEKSIWYNSSLAEYNGNKNLMVTSLHFISSDKVNIYTSVLNEQGFEVTPFLYARGEWSVSGNAKKEGNVDITTQTIDGKKLIYKGKYWKDKGMLLATDEAVIKPFLKVKETEIP